MGKRWMILVLVLTALSGCYYDNEAVLYGIEPCLPDAPTYSLTIAPLLERSCISCHSQSVVNGGVILDSYAQVRAVAINGKLVGSVSHASGFSPMPKNAPQLSECNINAIRAWVEAGSPEN